MIKVLELFSGYMGASWGLKLAGIEHEVVGYSDIDKGALKITEINFPHLKDKALGDITKINPDKLEDFDLLTGGFSCQPFSQAGLRKGFADANKGNMFFEIIRIAEVKKPKIMLLENVEGILSHDYGRTFEIIIHELKRIGYYVRWKKLYSRKHGTPQNRPRVWFACFRDINHYNNFDFPASEKLTLTVKDLLEDEVDEKYYLNDNQLSKIQAHIKKQKEKNNGFGNKPLDINKYSQTLCSFNSKIENMIPYFKIADYRGDEGLRIKKNNKLSPTLLARERNDMYGIPVIKQDVWRRLTPRECFRLMGFFNDEIKFGDLSDSKLYFLAGNGWDINVASKIFKQMFIGNSNDQKLLSRFGL